MRRPVRRSYLLLAAAILLVAASWVWNDLDRLLPRVEINQIYRYGTEASKMEARLACIRLSVAPLGGKVAWLSDEKKIHVTVPETERFRDLAMRHLRRNCYGVALHEIVTNQRSGNGVITLPRYGQEDPDPFTLLKANATLQSFAFEEISADFGTIFSTEFYITLRDKSVSQLVNVRGSRFAVTQNGKIIATVVMDRLSEKKIILEVEQNHLSDEELYGLMAMARPPTLILVKEWRD